MFRQLAISVVTSGIAVLLLILFWKPAPRDASAASPLGDLAQFAPKGAWATPSLCAGSEKTCEAMNKPIPLVEWKDVPISEVVQQLGRMAGVQVHPLWKSIEAAGLTSEFAVSLKVTDASAAQVLRLIVREVGGGDSLDYYVEQDTVYVTTREQVDARVSERVYDVKDLITYAVKFRRAVAAAEPAPPPISGVPQTSGNMGSGFPYSSRRWQSGTGVETEIAESMVKFAESSIEPSCWVENGGRYTIHYWSGRLIVHAGPRTHEKLERLLQDLRATSK
jgi:hypothetical protein